MQSAGGSHQLEQLPDGVGAGGDGGVGVGAGVVGAGVVGAGVGLGVVGAGVGPGLGLEPWRHIFQPVLTTE